MSTENLLTLSKKQLLAKLWQAEPQIRKILANSRHVEEARFMIFDYLNRLERDLYNMKSDTYFVNLNMIEKRNAKECIRVLSNTMRTENEYLTKASPLECLCDLACDQEGALDKVTESFLCEYIALFRGITGKTGKHSRSQDLFKIADGREAAKIRSSQLDDLAALIRRNFRRYIQITFPCKLEPPGRD
jgi:lysine 2,3-aminomutase